MYSRKLETRKTLKGIGRTGGAVKSGTTVREATTADNSIERETDCEISKYMEGIDSSSSFVRKYFILKKIK